MLQRRAHPALTRDACEVTIMKTQQNTLTTMSPSGTRRHIILTEMISGPSKLRTERLFRMLDTRSLFGGKTNFAPTSESRFLELQADPLTGIRLRQNAESACKKFCCLECFQTADCWQKSDFFTSVYISRFSL